MIKLEKGQYGYLKNQRTKVLIMTLLMFALSIAVFLFGYIKTGNKASLFTVIAVLGMLPASKSLVNLIMYCRAKDISGEVYQKLLPFTQDKCVLYGLFMTSYDKNFPISCMVIDGLHLIAFSEYPSCDIHAAAKHMETYLKQNGYKKEDVTVFNELEKFKNRIQTLSDRDTEKNMEENITSELQIAALMKNLSL